MSPAEARTWGGPSLRSVRGLQGTEEHCQIQHIQQPVNPPNPHAFRERLWYNCLSTSGPLLLVCSVTQITLNTIRYICVVSKTTRRKQVEWEAPLGRVRWRERQRNSNVALRNCYWPQYLDVSPRSVRRKGIVMAWVIKSLLLSEEKPEQTVWN